MFDVSPITIYRRIRVSEMPAVEIGGSWRIPASAVTALEERANVVAAASRIAGGEER